jgi:ribonuclease BN (tRNA processing enzyme)
MRVELLGTGGYHPNERRHTACLLLPELGVAFDAGTSFFRVPPRLETPELDIFLTHAHLDHIIGLTYILVPLLNKTIRQARVHATPRTLQAVREHLLTDAVFPVVPDYEWIELPPVTRLPGGATVRFHPLNHPGGSVGYRLDGPSGSLAYMTDTMVDGTYTEFIRGVDVLIHECYFPDEQAEWAAVTGHSHTTPVAELARQAGVGRLMLTHIDPQRPDDDPIGLATARAIFPATELAEDLMTVEF